MSTINNNAVLSGQATTFNQGRWVSCDFDSATTGGVSSGAIASGTISYQYAATAGVFGVGRLTSSTSANSGGYFGWLSSQIMVQVGCVFRDVFLASGVDSTLAARMGWQDSATATAPANGAWLDVSNLTISAKTALASATTTSATAVLTANTYYVLDIEVVSSSAIRFVVWQLSDGSKLLDVTVATNLPIGVNSYSLHLATGNSLSAKALLDCDYIGRGLARPTFMVTPP